MVCQHGLRCTDGTANGGNRSSYKFCSWTLFGVSGLGSPARRLMIAPVSRALASAKRLLPGLKTCCFMTRFSVNLANEPV